MSRYSRPQIHAYALGYLGAFVIALTIALAMLAHATMAGGPQWSAGALAGVVATGLIAAFVALIVGFTAAVEWLGRGRARREPDDGVWSVTPEQAHRNAEAWFREPEDAAYDEAAFWAQEAAHEAVYDLGDVRELSDDEVRGLAQQRADRRRHAAGHR